MTEDLKAKVDALEARLAEASRDYRDVWLQVEEMSTGKAKQGLAVKALDGDPGAIAALEKMEKDNILLAERKSTLKIQRNELQKRYSEAKAEYLGSRLGEFKNDKRKLKAWCKKTVKEIDDKLQELLQLSMQSNEASNYAGKPRLFNLESFSHGGQLYDKFKDWINFYLDIEEAEDEKTDKN